jgi:hypothetical protein
MKIRKIVFGLIFLFLMPYIAHSQLKTVFSAPEEILKKCNHFKVLPYRQMVEVETFVSKSLYLYFENSVIDTVFANDTVIIVDEATCIESQQMITREKIKLTSGKVYLLNDPGTLLYKLPFDDVLFPFYEQKIMNEPSPSCGIISFMGFYNGGMMYYGFKTEFDKLAFIKSETLDEAPLILKLNGKWGIMDFEGIIVADFVFDRIEYFSTNADLILNINNLIARKYFLDKVKRE